QTKDAKLWGSTAGFSASLAGGAVFTINLDGTLLQSTFLSETPVGIAPNAPLIQARDGKIYGTTSSYGHAPEGQAVCCGTVFVIDPSGSAAAASSPVPTSTPTITAVHTVPTPPQQPAIAPASTPQ